MTFRETIRKSAEGEATWIRRPGGKSEYAHVKIRILPLPRGEGFKLKPVREELFPAKYLPGVEEGLASALASGPAGRYEVTDIQAEVTNGSYHEVDSSTFAFAQATEEAVRKALQLAESYLLEPVLNVTVEVPEEFTGSVIGELNARGARITSMDVARGTGARRITIVASVPERTMHEYNEWLAQITQERGAFASDSAGYDELPWSVARQMRYCVSCERKVLPVSPALCPDCGSALGQGDDFAAV
jgi:elongation factor G